MIITKTPFRISFVGGGTDLEEYYKTGYGAVVSAAINKYMYITVNKRFDDSIRVSYTKTEIVDSVDEIQHELVRECMKMVGITKGIEITSISDIPAGTGLASSSCFTVGLLNALYTYVGDRLSAHELAEKACEIEIDRLGHPIGKQDQYAASYGALNYFQFNKDNTVDRRRISMPDFEFKKMDRKLMMFYTGISRNADTVLCDQKKETSNKLAVLDEMRDQAGVMEQMLKEEGFNRKFGEMLNEGWMRKRTISSKITSSEIDVIYQKALDAGAVGGKLLGAGGGGFLLIYCDEEKQEAVQKTVGLKQLDFRISPYGSRVVYFV